MCSTIAKEAGNMEEEFLQNSQLINVTYKPFSAVSVLG